ncbi:aldo/keto reductase [Rathayibacter caricis DSM 15933]|uniref:Aldo/keto reductase n=1 Tax=Rathayibacter caricis DSM 15933 TaxID=1328867 RepID=A0A2T4UQV3_9MICO|nr:aldo/keto reductase [Rathayibacter caricis]PTL71904.1 aldo/keto reductase [Rathayibacter caricis DSM 15933]
MQYRTLGRSGLKVSTVTFGTMTFGGKGVFAATGSTGVDEARRLLDVALDRGVNLLDTANVYSNGVSEEVLGEALKGRRDRTLIASKVRGPMGDGPNDAGLSRHHIIAQCEGSLRRLGTDHLDLYQVHEWDGQTPLEETLSALDSLLQAGKIRYVGSSNYAGWQLSKALGVSKDNGWSPFISQQIHYTLQAREAEYELLPLAQDAGVGVLVWSPLAGGLLSGKHRRNQAAPEDSRMLAGWDEPPIRDEDALYDIVDVLVRIGETHGVSAAQVALAWLLTRPAVSSLVVGARTEAQLTDNLAAAELELTSQDLLDLDAVSAPPLIYPYWHHAKSAADRLGPFDLVANEALARHRP